MSKGVGRLWKHRRLPDDPGCGERVECRADLLRNGEHAHENVAREVAADDRCGPKHVPDLQVEPVQPCANHRLYRCRDVQCVERTDDTRTSGIDTHRSGFDETVGDLFEEERIATGPFVHAGDQLGRHIVCRKYRVEHDRARARGQRPQRQRAMGLAVLPLAARRRAGRHQHEQTVLGEEVNQTLQRLVRPRVDPVPVLEQHDHWLALRRGDQQTDQRLLDDDARLIGAGRTGRTVGIARDRKQPEVIGKEVFEVRGRLSDAGRHVSVRPLSPAAMAGVAGAAAAPARRAYTVCPARTTAAADHGRDQSRVDRPAEFQEQPALAEACLPADRDQSTVSGPCLGERLRDGGQLPITARERGEILAVPHLIETILLGVGYHRVQGSSAPHCRRATTEKSVSARTDG